MRKPDSSRVARAPVTGAVFGGVALLTLLASRAPAQIYDVHYDGFQQYGALGESVSTGFDCDGDGVDDVAIGAPGESVFYSRQGVVLVYSGATHALLAAFLGPDAYSNAGTSVALCGDIDGDGFGDVAIGAPEYGVGQGLVAAYSVVTGSLLWNIVGNVGEHLGKSVAAAGDVDHDGHMDVLAGAWGSDTTYLYGWGTGVLHSWVGSQSGSRSGSAVAGNVDVDGDGTMDVIVGSPFYSTTFPTLVFGRGRIDVYSGKSYALLFSAIGDSAYDYLGSSVCGIGDMNGDGKSEVLAGAPYSSAASPNGGLAREYDSSGAKIADFLGAADDYFGTSSTRVPDVDGDGIPEFAIGGVGFGYAYESFVELHHGGDNALMWTFSPPDPTDYSYATSISGGDLDGDGTGDLVVGTQLASPNGVNAAGRVDVWLGANATAKNYGTGFPGTLGVPGFAGQNDPGIGTTFTAQLDDSVGAPTTGLLVVGFSRTTIVTSAGGVLLVTPFEILPIQIPTAGLQLSGAIPNDTSLLGVVVDLQVLEVDPGARHRLSFTPGLELKIGVDYP